MSACGNAAGRITTIRPVFYSRERRSGREQIADGQRKAGQDFTAVEGVVSVQNAHLAGFMDFNGAVKFATIRPCSSAGMDLPVISP